MAKKPKAPRCNVCRSELIEIKGATFSFTIFLVLVFMGFLPGVIYYFFVKFQDNVVCLKCTTDAASVGETRNKNKW